LVDYNRLGDQIFNEYFQRIDGDGKGLLEEIIIRVARENELNPEEIARIAQYVNTKVFLKLFKTVADKTVEFEVADPDEIVKKLLQLQNITPTDDTFDFSAEHYHIDDNSQQQEEDPITIDYVELHNLYENLKDKMLQARIRAYEERPTLVRRIASRMRETPEPVTVFVVVRKIGGPPAEELLKAACEIAGLEFTKLDKLASGYKPFLIDEKDELSQNVASYVKMLEEEQDAKESLEKVASVLDLFKRPFRVLSTGASLNYVGGRAKDYKNKILSSPPEKRSISVINGPRFSDPNNRSYISPM